MRNRRTPVLLGLLTGLMVAVPGAHAAQAASAETGGHAAQVPGSAMRLSVAVPEQKSAEHTTLTCSPVGGSHPDAEAACAALERSGGDFTALGQRDQQTMCTLEYAPVRLSATGTWQGAPVDYDETFSNPCVARAQTEGVFDFRTA
ncbi:SSI family serine proteinase inhibitor [Streptomonospora litoralis]|uniref:Subtilisin inhibitor-like protein 2 n=1 Tax=Streptomonospora litoralis TaxID=2498135 RepID=A0A4P6Q2C9_9ACTN|nr:SSI family serine proteinase inhibitor [Streptomonospora litoralis]QBI54663.1 Subtilisin inhibitor-like protein 2 [Streptomonospora litoralis]